MIFRNIFEECDEWVSGVSQRESVEGGSFSECVKNKSTFNSRKTALAAAGRRVPL